jgi:hypothetical protein
MNPIKTTLLLLLSLPLFALAQGIKEDPLPAPFSLHWGQGPEEPVEWARKNKLVMRWVEKPGQTESILEIDSGTAEKLPGVEFNKIRFQFRQGRLVEATVIYEREDTQEILGRLEQQIAASIQKKWGAGQESAEATRSGDTSKTRTWKVAEGRYILFNTTNSQPDSSNKLLWIGKVVYRHHALSLLIQSQETP